MSHDCSTLMTVAVAGFRCNCCPDFSNAASAASMLKNTISGNSAQVSVEEFPTRESYESWVSENTNGSEWLEPLVLSGAVPCTVVSVNGEWGKEPCHIIISVNLDIDNKYIILLNPSGLIRTLNKLLVFTPSAKTAHAPCTMPQTVATIYMVFEDSTEVCYFSLLSHDAPLIAVRPQPGAWDRDCPGASLPWVWSARFRNTHSP